MYAGCLLAGHRNVEVIKFSSQLPNLIDLPTERLRWQTSIKKFCLHFDNSAKLTRQKQTFVTVSTSFFSQDD